MDPITTFLASRVVGFLVPLAEKGTEAFAKSVGVATVDKVSELLASLRRRLAGDSKAAATLDQFESNPEQQSAALQQLLAERMERDPQLAAEIEQHINRIGPQLEILVEGDEIKVVKGPTVGDIRAGTVTSTTRVKKADKVDAGKFGNVG